MRKNTAGIIRGNWSFNEKQYYLAALHYYEEVIFIDPSRVTYTLDLSKKIILITQEGVLLNDLAMAYTFGRKDETLLLVKCLELCGCPISDPYHAISRDCMGKITDSLNMFAAGVGTTSHILTSLALAEEYINNLSANYFPLLNKPVSGNKGKGIVSLNTPQEAIEFCASHFRKSDIFLFFEQLMNYTHEFRVYVVDGCCIEAYEKVREGNSKAIVMNLHQGARAMKIEEAVKQQIFQYIQQCLPERYHTGIFGIDLAMAVDGQWHIIEINRTPGFTGLSTLGLLNFPRYVHKILHKRSRKFHLTDDSKQRQIITLLGDTNPGESYQLRLEERGKENILKTKGYDFSFSKFHTFLQESDFTIANLEACITNQQHSTLETIKPYLDWTDIVETPSLLKRLQINAVSLANNHTMDFGATGMEQTLNILRDHDIAFCGAGRSAQEAIDVLHHHLSVNEKKLHLIVTSGFEYRKNHVAWNYYATPDNAGVNSWGKSNAIRQLTNLRNLYPNAFLIAFPHWGSNYQYVTERQKTLAKSLIEAGADLIIGHGSHMMQEIELYKGHWIIYGIGNFVYNSPGRFSRHDVLPFALLTRLTVYEHNNQICINVQNYPTYIDNNKTDYQSHFVTERQFRQVIDFFMPHKGVNTNLEHKMRAGKDKHGFYLSFDIPSHQINLELPEKNDS
ncbi:MAG: CapA family protein [Pseudomonadota bacterium]